MLVLVVGIQSVVVVLNMGFVIFLFFFGYVIEVAPR